MSDKFTSKNNYSSWDSEDYRESRKQESLRKDAQRSDCVSYLLTVTDELEMKTQFHVRLWGVFDIYPSSLKYHSIRDNKRGRFKSMAAMEVYLLSFASRNNLQHH